MKLCECGCGQLAPVASRSHAKYGWVKGEPVRFVRGHAMRGRTATPETREKLRRAMQGREITWADKISDSLRGDKGPGWRRGWTEREGRRLVLVGRDHPMADVYGYTYEHRLVAAEKFGRHLVRADVVHHLDCNPRNNHPDNLVLVTNSQHSRIHNLIRKGTEPIAAWRTICG